MAVTFYILDLETTGLLVASGKHEICELSILRCSDRVQMTRQVRVDRPLEASWDAMRITGKTLEDYGRGISKQQLIADVDRFLAEDGMTPAHRILTGHNVIGFDKIALWYLWNSQGKRFGCDLWLDTLDMTRAAAKKRQLIRPKVNLNAACEIFGVQKVAGAHNAKADTRNTYLLWEKLMAEVDYLDYVERMPHGGMSEVDDASETD